MTVLASDLPFAKGFYNMTLITVLLRRRLVVQVCLFCHLLQMPVFADDRTEIGKLAKTLEPGQWAELKSEGYVQTSLMRGNDILAYAGRASWDATSQQVFFIGQVHLKGPPSFIAYSVKDNTWRPMPTPPWAESLKWFHAYENNAIDSERGIFYHHPSNLRAIHRYDASKQTWTELPELSAPTGHGTAMEYFPERKGLVRVLGGEVCFWSEEKNEWTRLKPKLRMGSYHNFASYSPVAKSVLFGGGNDSLAVYTMSADGTIRNVKDSPAPLGIGWSLNVVDPVTGALLVLTKEAKFFEFDVAKDDWKELSQEGLPFLKYKGHSVSAAPISSEGVVLFFSSNPQGMKTYVYKHSHTVK